MGLFVVSVSFRQKISSICERKMHQIDPEIADKLEHFVVLDAISVQYPRDLIISF